MADSTREALGGDRLAWLESLPMAQAAAGVQLVHATPGNVWQSPGPGAADSELESAYEVLEGPLTVYAHIHHPFVRRIGRRVIANTGALSLSYDGDARASYLLIEDGVPAIRRVAYDLEAEAQVLGRCGLPHAGWVTETMRRAAFLLPQG